MAGVLQHLRSSTLAKRPNPASMVDGQVAINYASGSPGMFFKDSNGSLVKVGPVHVGSGAPNVSPASGGTAGNSLGEQWLDTSGGTYVFKIWDGAAWRSEAGEFVNTTGDTMTGALGIIAGSASTPGLFFSGDANSGLYSPGADQVAISTNGTGRLFVDANGQVGVGTTSPGTALDVVGVIRSKAAGGEGGQITLTDVSNTEVFNVDVDNAGIIRLFSTVNNKDIQFGQLVGTGCNINFYTGQLERARIDSSGRLLVGTSSNRTGAALQIEGTTFGTSLGTITNNSANSAPAYFQLIKSRGTSVGSQALVSNGDGLGNVQFVGTDGTQQLVAAAIEGIVDGTPGTNDMPGRLMFSTTADGASSPTERARITSDGFLRVGKSSADINVQGISLAPFGTAAFSRDAEIPLFVNRNTDDGALVVFRQEGTDEGSISVSGTTVSYNGAHLSRWSQLPGGAERTEILRGTVLSNIDEMCGWGEEANEQLNRMKVSDVEGDPNVAGVFQAWDDDDDTYTDDFYCAMTGDFIIRVAEGVTVQRGDLLMSAGDGTAKPQDDDIVRSKTIAKVTSSHVTCTYDDGSYCVPCVLMAC
jgi:hypothetical protein